jgi:SAM-dependent methyltransferase
MTNHDDDVRMSDQSVAYEPPPHPPVPEASVIRSWMRGCWRLAQPLRSTRGKNWLRLPSLYARFWRDWRRFSAMGGNAPFELLGPTLFDRDPSTQSGGGHYFFQDIWALRKLSAARPGEHHDVGSRIDGFVGQATAICPVVYWDIRPTSFVLPGLECRIGSILELPVADRSLPSLSCLHTAEHVGLGRYGDPIDPEGTDKTLRELARILAPGGRLLFSMPVGVEQLIFNTQRIWPPSRPVDRLAELELIEFSAVNDAGEFVQNVSVDSMANQKYACGLYEFRRPS